MLLVMKPQRATETSYMKGIEMLDNVETSEIRIASETDALPFKNAPRYPLSVTVEKARSEALNAVEYLQSLEVLYAEFVSLEEKANVALYRFLEGVFTVFARIKLVQDEKGKKEASRMRETFEIIMDERRRNGDIDYTRATSLETKILRFVCGKLTPAREKAWVRVLKIALKTEDVISGKISFAAWLASEGGVYEVAHTNEKGKKPSEEEAEQVAEAQKLIKEWLGTEVFGEVANDVLGSIKNKDEKFAEYTVTLNRYDGNQSNQVIELCDPVSIQRLLLLLGKQITEPVRTRDEVDAEEAAALDRFTTVTGRKPEIHRE